jgi:DNA-binding transcriptional regulator YhcF (GntR family)
MITIRGEPRLHAALERAEREAAARGHDRVATRHLALGLLGEDGGAAALIRALADGDALRRRIEGSLPRARRPAGPPDVLPYSPNAQRSLALAARAAEESPVRTEHLLLALLELDGGVARFLRGAGVTEERVRERAARLAPAASSLAFLAVSPDAAAPVYQQIVHGVREAVADGRLRAEDRLPTVRQLAAALGIAPGTAARAYQELEQAGVVVTDGARGTRVAPRPTADVEPEERAARLAALLRPVAVAASYLGASADEVRDALEDALAGILVPVPLPSEPQPEHTAP